MRNVLLQTKKGTEQETPVGKTKPYLYIMSSKDSRRKEQTPAVVVDLGDAYNRVHFKLLMEHLELYKFRLTFTRWFSAALQERKVAM